MNKFIAFAVVFAAVVAVNADWHDGLETCKTSALASDADVAEFKSHQIPSSHNGKCMLLCMQRRMGMVLNSSNQLDAAATISSMQNNGHGNAEMKAKMAAALTNCDKQGGGSDDCEAAAVIATCLKAQNPWGH